MTKKVLAVFAADTHLQPNAWAGQPELCGDAEYSFQQLCQTALRFDVPLILGGDIFDRNRPDPESVAALVTASAGVDLWYVQGDHDLDPRQPWPALAASSRHLVPGLPVRLGNYFVAGMDFCTPDKVASTLATVSPQATILVTHQAWTDIRPMGVSVGNCADVLPPHVQYLLAGDTHLCEQIQFGTTADGRPRVLVSPGSTCMQATDEPADKYMILICEDTEQPGQLVFERKQLRTRPVLRYSVYNEQELHALCRLDWVEMSQADSPMLPAHLAKAMVYVEYATSIPQALGRLRAAIEPHMFLFTKALPSTMVLGVNVTPEMLAGKQTAIDELTAVANTVTPVGSLQNRHVLKLLQATDSKSVNRLLDEVVTEFLQDQAERRNAAAGS